MHARSRSHWSRRHWRRSDATNADACWRQSPARIREYSGRVSRLTFDVRERSSLCDLLDELGPDAATVLTPWTTRDIAVHLYLREHDPVAGPGLVIPGAWARLAERHHKRAAGRDFSALVASVRSGPRGVFRLGWLRRVPNLNEFFVHHEDVRRANGGAPRDLDAAMNQALWANVRVGARILARRLRGCGMELHDPSTGETVHAHHGKPVVRISGEPGELLLFLFGRQDAAVVEMNGPPGSVDTVRSARLGV